MCSFGKCTSDTVPKSAISATTSWHLAGLFNMAGLPILTHNPEREATAKEINSLHNPRQGLRISFEQSSLVLKRGVGITEGATMLLVDHFVFLASGNRNRLDHPQADPKATPPSPPTPQPPAPRPRPNSAETSPAPRASATRIRKARLSCQRGRPKLAAVFN